jgi:hypothetical protein
VLIGAQGSGKSSLLRHAARSHRGVALQISLLRVLGALARGQAVTDSSAAGDGLRARSESLLALAIASDALTFGLEIDRELLRQAVSCAPGPVPTVTPRLIDVWRERVLAASDEACVPTEALRSFVAALAAQCARAGGNLLLTLDDAELVRPELLPPAVSLLAPAGGLVSLLAVRPGVRLPEGAFTLERVAHLHLGARPRSAAWTDHVRAILTRRYPRLIDTLPTDLCDLVIAIGRDSVATALSLLIASSARRDPAEGIALAATHLRALRLGAMRASLLPYNANFEDFLSGLRQRILREYGRIPGPVTLLLEPLAGQLALFPGDSRFQRFADLAVRVGALSLPEGRSWGHQRSLDALEVAPLLLWTDVRSFARGRDARALTLAASSGALFRRRGRALRPPVVVVACDRVGSGHACRAAEWRELAAATYAAPGLDFRAHPVARVAVGTISGAAALIAAGTLSPSLLFDVGVAYQSGVPVLLHAPHAGAVPAVEALASRASPEAAAILGELVRVLARRGGSGVRRAPRPVPGLVLWYGTTAPTETFANCATIAELAGLRLEHCPLGPTTLEALDQLLRAQLLIVSEQAASSPLVHLAAGAFGARRVAGYGSSAGQRRLVVIGPDQSERLDYAAAARGTVVCVRASATQRELLQATRAVRAWSLPR